MIFSKDITTDNIFIFICSCCWDWQHRSFDATIDSRSHYCILFIWKKNRKANRWVFKWLEYNSIFDHFLITNKTVLIIFYLFFWLLALLTLFHFNFTKSGTKYNWFTSKRFLSNVWTKVIGNHLNTGHNSTFFSLNWRRKTYHIIRRFLVTLFINSTITMHSSLW